VAEAVVVAVVVADAAGAVDGWATVGLGPRTVASSFQVQRQSRSGSGGPASLLKIPATIAFRTTPAYIDRGEEKLEAQLRGICRGS
jgi:hypothetical protein